MKWCERMKIEIKVDKSYLNRDGIIMDVIEKLTDNDYHVTNKHGIYSYPKYVNGYIVTKFGGFGDYPNHRDLIKIIN